MKWLISTKNIFSKLGFPDRVDGPHLTFYQRIESSVAFVLTLVITVVIFVALYRLAIDGIGSLLFGAENPLDHKVFQEVFGQIMTVLIALEFNHTLQYVVTRQQSIIQTKTVLLIALLAISRKFIILDVNEISAKHMFALAAITLVLGLVYWLIQDRDDKGLISRGRP